MSPKPEGGVKKNRLALWISLFILLALPAISLYYSFQGSLLRKKSLVELSPKGRLDPGLASLLSGEFNYRVIGSACEDVERTGALIDQFAQEKIQFVILQDSAFEQRFPARQVEHWKKQNILLILPDPGPHLPGDQNACTFVLVNKNSEILNHYNFTEPVDRRKLVEHLAFLVTSK
ncbi:MAG TPA: hypothetical protein PKM27_10130 [Saprospiraceae bacterium]|nr:hypothetical protein [Saprospiraceae bacterium]